MRIAITILLITISIFSNAQSPVGIWQTIDDNEGDVRTEVEFCPKCPGNKKDQLLIGLIFMWNLEYDNRDERWEGGRILEPESGREFKCYLQMKNANHIKVRGYLGFPAIGRSQNWYRKGTLLNK